MLVDSHEKALVYAFSGTENLRLLQEGTGDRWIPIIPGSEIGALSPEPSQQIGAETWLGREQPRQELAGAPDVSPFGEHAIGFEQQSRPRGGIRARARAGRSRRIGRPPKESGTALAGNS